MSNYTRKLRDIDGDMFDYPEWKSMVKVGAITPDDGTGYVANDFAYDLESNPFKELPEDGKWVVWFNK